MKLIFTVTNDLNYDQRMIRICSSLQKAGYEVELVGRKKRTSRPLADRPFGQKRLSVFFQKGKLFYLAYNIRLFFYLLFARYDAVCAIDLDTILPVLGATAIRGKKRVYDAHEYFTELPEVVNRKWTKKVWDKIADFAIPKFKNNYTVCDSLAVIFMEKYKSSFTTIRNLPFAQARVEKTKTIPENPIFLYQGALNTGRGLEEMIAALPLIEKGEFWLAGEGDLSKELRALAAQSPAQARIKFLGYVSPEELKKITQKATIGLNLLQNLGKNYYYSLANKAFDYMQAGVPSLHPDFPEYQKINMQYQVFFLLKNLKPESIALVINALLKNEKVYQKMVAHNLKAAGELTWEKEEGKLLDFWASVLHT